MRKAFSFFVFFVLLVPILPTALRWLQNRGSSISKQKLLVFVLIGTSFYLLNLPISLLDIEDPRFSFMKIETSSAYADVLNQTVLFNIDPQYDYLSRKQVSATLRKISDKAYWYVSDDYWAGASDPERNLFSNELNNLSLEFDSRIYPIETQFWGTEANPGVDNDSRVTILVAKLISQAGGYFDTTHLYKKTEAPLSNEREMFFINSSSVLGGRAKIFLAHEFQHLIGFYQKDILKNITEDVWLNEARAEYTPRQLGYDDVFDTSNIRRRISAFSQNPSDPLAEWKNEPSDYGAITLFMYYLVDNYGDKVLVESQKSTKPGIESINEALILNNFPQRFSDIFSDWSIANILNDSSINSSTSSPQVQKYAYKSEHLRNFRISPDSDYTISGDEAILSISNTVKDWQPWWYEFNTPVGSGLNLNLKIDFSADSGTKFLIPYVAFKINGQKEVGYLPLGSTSSPQVSGTLFLKNFGSDIYKVVLIPANHSKLSDFTKNDPAVSFNLKAQMTTEFQEAMPTSSEVSVQDLLNQISALQNQLTKLRQETNPFPLNRDLYISLMGEDVRWLQDFFIRQGVYPQALVTGYFGTLTKNSAIRFQQKYGIFPQAGYVGPKTRVKIMELAN